MLLYSILKTILKVALKIFFRRFQIDGAAHLNFGGPLLVIGNHPNTFMDPLIVAVLMRQQVAFLGNGSIFNRYTRPILGYFNVIPIYRAKDMPNADVPMSQSELNKKTFQKCYDYLAKGGTVLLFPEGTSELERRLREIKTGTARIALGAEAEYDFKLNIKILPIGLNYSDPSRFRSDIFVNVGEPIEVADFKEKHKPESFETVKELTELIENRFRQLTIVTENDDEDEVVKNIETLYKNVLFEDLNLNKNDKRDDFSLINRIIEAVRYSKTHRPEAFKTLQIKMSNYLENLQILQISSETFIDARNIIHTAFVNSLIIVLGFPFYFFGLIHNYLPYILPSRIASAISSERVYRAPIMLTVGIFTFPIFYGLYLWAFFCFSQNLWLRLCYAISLPIGGFVVLWYWPYLEKIWHTWRALWLMKRKPNMMNTLAQERNAIFGMLDSFRRAYIERLK